MPETKHIRSCSIWRALEIVGDKPTLLIMESYWLGTRRFSDFCKQTGLLKTVVNDRLQKLIQNGCLKRVPYSSRPKRYEYRGTRKLHDLYPAALAMLHWEKNWGNRDGKVDIILTHTSCGQITEPFPACRNCKYEVDARDVDWLEGPGVGTMPALYSRRRKLNPNMSNAIHTSLLDDIAEIIGDRWSTLIIRSVFTAINTFKDIQNDTQMATNILTERLQDLIAKDVLYKVEASRKRNSGYRLTEKGRDIYPIILSFMEWGDKWYAAPNGPPLLLKHVICENTLQMDMLCSNCAQPVYAKDMTFSLCTSGTEHSMAQKIA